MKIPKYVHPLPSFLNFLGGKGYKIITGGIYLRRDIYNDLKSENPNSVSVSLLIHEEAHRKSMNKSKSFKYAVSRKERLKEELNAYRVQFEYLKKHNQTYDLDHIAKKLSGPLYLYSTDYKTAKKELKKVWDEA